jgi:cytochrome b subunit of formate dehydrogenase
MPGTTVALFTERLSPPERCMLWTIAIVLFILWILGFGVFHAAGALIHLLLVAAVIVILIRLIQGRRPVV